MFDLFKRATRPGPPARTPMATPTRQSNGSWVVFDEPIPLPDVIEGNEQSDWALWEDSVTRSGSGLPDKHEIEPAAGASADPFANVGRNRDL